MYDGECNMKVVQTELNDAEYRILLEYARRSGCTIKEALREAALKLTISDSVDPNDPVFSEPPSAKRTGKQERTSAEHDKVLYGEVR